MPFAREYGGLLDNRSFGGAQVSRTFYARGQTGQQLLLGAYQALEQADRARAACTMFPRTEMLDLVVDRRHARAASSRATWSPARSSRTSADAVVLATGGYGNVFYLSTNAKGSQRHRDLARATSAAPRSPTRATRRSTRPASRSSGEYQSKLTLMTESLRNDGRVWVPKKHGRQPRRPTRSPRTSATTTSSASTRASATSSPRDIASRAAKAVCDEGRGVGPGGLRRLPRLRRRHQAARRATSSRERYGNLFEMYERITGEDPYKVPMRIYPAVHYTMGGLWVDYNLMSTIPGLFVIGEANFSDHGANRLGASALMQGLADGYFVLPYTIGDYLAVDEARARSTPTTPAFKRRRGGRRERDRDAARDQRQAHGRLVPPRARQDHVGELRHGAQRRRACRRRSSRSPRCARSSGRT